MKFFVFGQNLKVSQRIIASGTARILTADFRFSPEWDGMRKYAHFEQGEKKYPVLIENDKITADKNLNLGQGVWEVWVHGNQFDDDANFQRITTVKAKISVDPSGLCGDPLPVEPPSFGEQLDERVSALEAGGGAGGGGGTADHSKLINREQPDQHPMSAITGLTDALDGKQPSGDYAMADDIPKVPDWAMSPTKPTYNAQEVGALSQSELQSGVDRALEQAKQSGEFDGKDGKDGTDGKPGRDGTDGKPGTNGKDGGHYTPSISQPSPDTMRIEFVGSLPDMPPVDPATVTLPKGEGGGTPIKKMTETTATLFPDTEYIWGEVASLTLDFAPVPEDGFSHDFIWDFVSGEIPTTLNLPESIKWAGGAAPKIESGKTYQMLVHNGGAYYAEF